MQYYLTSFTHATFYDDSHPDRVLYNSSVSKHSPFLVWRFYIPDSTVRLDAVSRIDDDSVVVAGTSESYTAKPSHRLFVAIVVVHAQTRRIAMSANYTSPPAAFVKVARVLTINRRVFVCGLLMPVKSHGDGGESKQSGSFLFVFDLALRTNSTMLSQRGEEGDNCVDIIQVEKKSIHIAQNRYAGLTSYGVVTAKSLDNFNSPSLWETVLDSATVAGGDKSVPYNNHTDVIILSACHHKLSIFVVTRVFNRVTKSGAYAAVVKLSARTGVVLWVHRKFMANARGMELAGSIGAVVASDHYVYTVLRYRNVTGEERTSEKMSNSKPTYASFTVRVSIWGRFDVTHDVSLPLWVSTDVRGPAAAVAYSELLGKVKSLGGGAAPFKAADGLPDGRRPPGAEGPPVGGAPPGAPTNGMKPPPQIATSAVLPLGPAVNDAKAGEVPFGSIGSQFLRMTFEVRSSGREDVRILDIAMDVLAEMMRLSSTQVQKDGRLKLQEEDLLRGVENEIMQTYGLLVRGHDLSGLEKRVRELFETITRKRDWKGFSLLELRLNMKKAGALQFSDLVVRSRGVTKAPDGDEKKRSAADVAQDLVRKTTITGVAVAGILVAVVALVVGCAKVRRMWKVASDSRASFATDGPLVNITEEIADRPDFDADGIPNVAVVPDELIVV